MPEPRTTTASATDAVSASAPSCRHTAAILAAAGPGEPADGPPAVGGAGPVRDGQSCHTAAQSSTDAANEPRAPNGSPDLASEMLATGFNGCAALNKTLVYH